MSHSTLSTGVLDSILVTRPSMSVAPSGRAARVSGVTLTVDGVMMLASAPSLMMPLMVNLSPQGAVMSIGVLGVTVVGSRRGEAYWVMVVPEGMPMTMTSALWDRPPLVPVMRKVQVPGGVPALAVKMTDCLPRPVLADGVTLPAV